MNRVRAIGGAVALAGVALLAAPPAWAADASPVPTTSPVAQPEPAPTLTSAPTPPSTATSAAVAAPPAAALPRAAVLTTRVSPRVSPPGSVVTATGAGCTRVHVVVDGQPSGWYDVPPRHLDRTLTATGAGWSTTFPMPTDPSTVVITCLDAGSTATTTTLISAPGAGITTSTGDAGGGLLSLQVDTQPGGRVELFTEKGTRVHAAISPTGLVTFRPPAGARSVTALAVQDIGENAEARQTSRVQAWTAALAVTPTPTPTPTPTATSAAGDGLAPSGGPGSLVLVGLLLIAGGTALTLRPGRDRARIPTRT